MPRLKLVRQPLKSNTCGQACAAMILGLTLEQSIALFTLPAEQAGTFWHDIVKVLRSKGVSCTNYLTDITSDKLPELCIVNVFWKHGNAHGHWVVKDGDRLLDPYYGEKAWSSMPLTIDKTLAPETKRAVSFGIIFRE